MKKTTVQSNINLETLAGGAFAEKLNEALMQVAENIQNPNTEATTKRQIQITFMTRHRQPPELPLSVTRLPKGQRASIPNFNVCNPKGIPIIVIISSKLDIRYSTAVSNPPQISQMILPKNFIASIL